MTRKELKETPTVPEDKRESNCANDVEAVGINTLPDTPPADMPSNVGWGMGLLNSEAVIFFALPFALWLLFIASVSIFVGFGNDFRIACSLLWSAFALTTIFSMFVNLIAQTVAADLSIYGLSLTSKFSEFLEQANKRSGREKAVLTILGCGKVCLVFFGSCSLFGGMFVIFLWLMSGSYLRIGG